MKRLLLVTSWVLLFFVSTSPGQENQEKEDEHKVLIYLNFFENSTEPGTFYTSVTYVMNGPPDNVRIQNAWIELVDMEKREVYARHRSVPNFQEDGKVHYRAYFPGAHSHVLPSIILELGFGEGEIIRNSSLRPLDETEASGEAQIEVQEVPEEDRGKKPQIQVLPVPQPEPKPETTPQSDPAISYGGFSFRKPMCTIYPWQH